MFDWGPEPPGGEGRRPPLVLSSHYKNGYLQIVREQLRLGMGPSLLRAMQG